VLCLGAAAQADVIPDRTTLNAILGGGGTTDNFETYSIGAGEAVILNGVTVLDENTIANGQGPNLVNNGATYSSGTLQWNGDQYFGMTSRAIIGDDFTITLTYDVFVTAMGVDMQAFSGYGDLANISVYNTSNVLIFATTQDLPGDASDVFFGYESAGGIGRVVLGGTTFTWSPNIDDHTYGVPAPASIALLGVSGIMACNRRRARPAIR
jgi:hypothetical protein